MVSLREKILLSSCGLALTGLVACGINELINNPLVLDSSEHRHCIEGIVQDERYISPSINNVDTALVGNATMQVGESKYSFSIKTTQGIYFVSVQDGVDSNKEVVDLAVNLGSKVRLGKNYLFNEPGSMLNLYPHDIKVL